MTRERAGTLINLYGAAWEKKDPQLVLEVFTEGAIHGDPGDHPAMRVGHNEIADYWQTKVVASQQEISFKLHNLWMDQDTVIAEWHVTFTDTARNLRVVLDEVAICGVLGEQFSSMRQYYVSTKSLL